MAGALPGLAGPTELERHSLEALARPGEHPRHVPARAGGPEGRVLADVGARRHRLLRDHRRLDVDRACCEGPARCWRLERGRRLGPRCRVREADPTAGTKDAAPGRRERATDEDEDERDREAGDQGAPRWTTDRALRLSRRDAAHRVGRAGDREAAVPTDGVRGRVVHAADRADRLLDPLRCGHVVPPTPKRPWAITPRAGSHGSAARCARRRHASGHARPSVISHPCPTTRPDRWANGIGAIIDDRQATRRADPYARRPR